MDHKAQSISEFMLERLREAAALEASGGAEPPPRRPAPPEGEAARLEGPVDRPLRRWYNSCE